MMEKNMSLNTIEKLVHEYYWINDFNCATTALKILSERFSVDLHQQTIDSAIGLHGAGEYGSQCGLVEGPLMFIGIIGRLNGMPDDLIINYCFIYAEEFEKKFGSLNCRELRPAGFHPDNPPHLCEELTVRTIKNAAAFIEKMISRK
jgi:hypothetical protein